MSNRFYSFIKLDFDDLQTEEDFDLFIDYYGIPENTFCCESLLETRDHYKFWILDSQTFSVICSVSREEPNKITWCDSFEEESHNFPTEVEAPVVTFDDLDLDTILDKIKDLGMSSLTTLEKEFLSLQSKNLNQ